MLQRKPLGEAFIRELHIFDDRTQTDEQWVINACKPPPHPAALELKRRFRRIALLSQPLSTKGLRHRLHHQAEGGKLSIGVKKLRDQVAQDLQNRPIPGKAFLLRAEIIR